MVPSVSPARLGRPVMIPVLKNTSACESIFRLFLWFLMRPPRTSDDVRSS